MNNLQLPRDPGQDTPEQAALRKELRAERLAPLDFANPTMLDFAVEAGRQKYGTQQEPHTLEDTHRLAARRLLQEALPTTKPEYTEPKGEDND